MFPLRKFKRCERGTVPGPLPSSLGTEHSALPLLWWHRGPLAPSRQVSLVAQSLFPWDTPARLLHPRGTSGLVSVTLGTCAWSGLLGSCSAPAGRIWPSQGWGSTGPSRARGWRVIDLYSHTHPQLSRSIPHVLIHGGKQVQPVWDQYGERLGSLCCGINHGTRSRAGVRASQGCWFGGNVFRPQTCSQLALLHCYLRDVISLILLTNTLSPLPGITGQ